MKGLGLAAFSTLARLLPQTFPHRLLSSLLPTYQIAVDLHDGLPIPPPFDIGV